MPAATQAEPPSCFGSNPSSSRAIVSSANVGRRARCAPPARAPARSESPCARRSSTARRPRRRDSSAARLPRSPARGRRAHASSGPTGTRRGPSTARRPRGPRGRRGGPRCGRRRIQRHPSPGSGSRRGHRSRQGPRRAGRCRGGPGWAPERPSSGDGCFPAARSGVHRHDGSSGQSWAVGGRRSAKPAARW